MFAIVPYFLLPEVLMALCALSSFVLGLVLKKEHHKYLFIVSMGTLTILAVGIFMNVFPSSEHALFFRDPLSLWGRSLGLISYALCLLFFLHKQEESALEKHECITLMLLSCCGMGIALCSGDLLATYVGMELQALPIIVMMALQRSHKSSEAALKYFFLNGFSSACFLFGMALLYFLTGGTTFALLYSLAPSSLINMTVLLLIVTSLLFKVGATPFHFWVPDAWQGSPLAITALLATGSKVFAVFLLARFVVYAFDIEHYDAIATFFTFTALLTMLWGATAALRQDNVKRLIAFASISHTGYMLAVLSQGTWGTGSMTLYLLVYLVASLGLFSILLWIQPGHKESYTNLSHFKGLVERNPTVGVVMIILLFSLSGMPPTLGFIGKYFIFRTLLSFDAYLLAVAGIIATVISMAYYLKIIKVIAIDKFDKKSLGYVQNHHFPMIAGICCVIVLLLPLMGLFLPVDWFTEVLSYP